MVEPAAGYLEGVKRLCEEAGIILIFDEMITGFRWHLGGAQKFHGTVPHLSTFGKAMGNGFSISALTGKRELMRLGGLITISPESSCSPRLTVQRPMRWLRRSRPSESTNNTV